MSQCPKRLKATFLIAKADYFIRKATMEGSDIVEQQRRQDFISGDSLLCCILFDFVSFFSFLLIVFALRNILLNL